MATTARRRGPRKDPARVRALRAWRLLPEDDSPPLPQPIGRVVHDFVARLGLAERLDEEEVRAEWLEIVGPFLARHSHPNSLKRGVLSVAVVQPSVRFELERSWKATILKKLQLRFGASKIRAVEFR